MSYKLHWLILLHRSAAKNIDELNIFEDSLSIKPLLAWDVVHHLALIVQTDGLPGETLLAGVSVSQLEHQVEQVGVLVLEHVLLDDGVDGVLDAGVDINAECQVLNITDNTPNIEPETKCWM